jgi:ribosomal protein L37AE/L43A
MTFRSLELGISALQAGSTAEGARLIRIALKSGKLTDDLRAIAYLWLAEIETDPARKRAFYNDALSADPSNQEARQRLAWLLSSQLPPLPTSAPAQTFTSGATVMQPSVAHTGMPMPSFNVADHVANIIGGPNGPGTAFFVSPDGILATTRFVVGSSDRVTVELHIGRQLTGYVLRALPEYDLAFIQIDHRLDAVLPITPMPRVPDEAPMIAVTYAGEMQRGRQRPTRRALANQWIPTTFTNLADAGGDPIFDERNYLVGMMTRNTGRRSAYFYGVHIAAIRRSLETFVLEAQMEHRVYCPACGAHSRAGGAGYFYCEGCGSVLPAAQHMRRYPVPQAEAYYTIGGAQCMRCGARVGFYKGHCLCCGQPPQTGTLTPP